MNYLEKNEIAREYYKKDFSQLNELLKRIRASLFGGEPVVLSDLDLDGLIDYKGEDYFLYITLFQEFVPKLRFGSKRKTLEDVLNRIIQTLRKNKRFEKFDVQNSKKCRILFECIDKRAKVDISKLHLGGEFDENRFESGINGIEIHYNKDWYNWLPTDAVVLNKMDLAPALSYLSDKMKLTKKDVPNSKKIEELKKNDNLEIYLTESKAFVSFEDTIIPLYRGNILYENFDLDLIKEIFIKSNDWLIQNMKQNGQFMYYYNPSEDNCIDHEHPTRKEPNLYYNDLRHSGGAVSLMRAYELTKDNKYLEATRKAIEWTIENTKFHKDKYDRECAYVYANKKAKLGGVALPVIAIMRYRINTNDKKYDRYIEAYVRHLLSRMTAEGEFMGYYIHPSYNNSKPLLEMSDKERMETFSFYYPGEALMALGMVANSYNENQELKEEIINKTRKAMDWIVDERPKKYSQLFTPLPSDAWLMQAIEEWADCKGFMKKSYLDFVFNDANTMMEKMYQTNDSPYIDFDGGMYYQYGDHYYPDGARCEGLIAAYYLAKKMSLDEFADKILKHATKAAKCQFQLWINEKNNYAHLNPDKSCYAIKFKATRQWVRVDSIQHVACFFIRLYWALR